MSAARFPGRYSDGRTAALHEVTAVVDTAALTVAGADGATLAAWPLGEVRQIGTAADDGTLRLCRAGDDARLTVRDPAFAARLAALCPNLRRPAYATRHVSGLRIALWAGGAAGSLALLFFVLIPFFAREIAGATPPWVEVRMGAWMTPYVIDLMADADAKRAHRTVCEAPRGKAALNRMLLGLVVHTPQLRYPIVLRVVNAAPVNAVALPGGQILVFRGLIEAAQHPNEVAGVVAHELAHVERRHPLEIAIERTSGALLLGLILGDVAGLSVAGVTASALLGGYYSREMEAEADERGLQLMAAAHFATRPVAGFFDRLARREPDLKGLLSLLATHPDSARRAERARTSSPYGGDAMEPVEWAAVKAMCR